MRLNGRFGKGNQYGAVQLEVVLADFIAPTSPVWAYSPGKKFQIRPLTGFLDHILKSFWFDAVRQAF
jgi:hypothetical protein